MGLFDFLKKNAEEKKIWETVFAESLGKMLAVQLNAAEYVDDWNLDFRNGYIYFGDQKHPVQFIGSENEADNTWMWGWFNINQLPEHLIRLAKQTRTLGKKWKIDALKTEKFYMTQAVNGHNLSTVACACADEDLFYYRCPSGSAAAFVAVQNAPKAIFQPVDSQKFINTVIQAIENYSVNHKIFAESFLQWNKTPYTWEGDTLIAHFPQQVYLNFETRQGKHYIIRQIRNT